MKLLDKIRGFLREEEPLPPPPAPEAPSRLKKTCKKCGKPFSYDASLDHVPNFCKDCKQLMMKEKEMAQRAGPAREIKRKCKECGKFFTFPSSTARYPSYCPNCRKRHQAAMKAKYAKGKKAGN